MTLKEALSTKTKRLSLSSEELDLALIEAGMDSESTYNPLTQGKELDMVYAGLLITAIQISEVREDDVSIKYTGDLKGAYSAIMRKWGLTDPYAPLKPTVRQIIPW